MGALNRRQFLQASAVAGTALGLRIGRASGQALGANERLRVAVAGLNGRGQEHLRQYLSMPGVEVAYLVDPDARLFDANAKKAEGKQGKAPQVVQDVRRALDDKNVDIVSIATPNHWHALMTIWSCQAGKDVYVEKPMSHNIHEGRIAVETARRHNRIVQHGTQSRSKGGWEDVVGAIATGKLGKLLVARGLCFKPRNSIGFKAPAEPPKELAFDIWLGPAQAQPYHENLVHYNWHWFWGTGNGDIGNQGVHEMDLARWGIPGATLPSRVISLGGRFGYEDQGETPNTQVAVFDYGATQLIFEVRGLPTDAYCDQKVGVVYHLEAGTIWGRTFYPKGSDKPAPLPEARVERGPGSDNFSNFIAAVRSRRREDLNAELLEGHYSASLCHLANASYRLGKSEPFNPKTRAFGEDTSAYETLARMEEHLSGNGLKLNEQHYRLGRTLNVDPKTGMTGDAEADAILKGSGRAPYLVPEHA